MFTGNENDFIWTYGWTASAWVPGAKLPADRVFTSLQSGFFKFAHDSIKVFDRHRGLAVNGNFFRDVFQIKSLRGVQKTTAYSRSARSIQWPQDGWLTIKINSLSFFKGFPESFLELEDNRAGSINIVPVLHGNFVTDRRFAWAEVWFYFYAGKSCLEILTIPWASRRLTSSSLCTSPPRQYNSLFLKLLFCLWIALTTPKQNPDSSSIWILRFRFPIAAHHARYCSRIVNRRFLLIGLAI